MGRIQGVFPGIAKPMKNQKELFSKTGRRLKLLLTLQEHPSHVFLEDTPPLPNALGPG
jgi:hypothetical protein